MGKSDRHEIYKEMLLTFEGFNGVLGGLCGVLSMVSDEVPMSQLHELYKHKPKATWSPGYWFARNSKGYQKRISILKQAITETQ